MLVLSLFAITLNSNGQKGSGSKTPCTLCEYRGKGQHDIGATYARELIQAFQEKFQMIDSELVCGGTIYLDKDYFKGISSSYIPDDDGLIFNFRYSVPVAGSNDLFLTFTNSHCDPEINSNYGFIKPSDTFGPLFRKSSITKDYDLALQADQKKPIYKPLDAQKISNKEANEVRTNFEGSTNWTMYLRAGEYGKFEGYFYYYSALSSFFLNTDCLGIRYYFGYDSGSDCENYIRVVLCAVDKNGKNIPGTWRENSNLLFVH